MTDEFLKAEANHIRGLLGKRESKAARASVEGALQSKFEGLQSLAAQVLATWRSEKSKERLRSWLEEKLCQQSSSLVGVAAQALRNRVEAGDAPWLLDLYFGAPGLLDRHHLLDVLDALPPGLLGDRIQSELRSTDRSTREAAEVLRNRLRFRTAQPAQK